MNVVCKLQVAPVLSVQLYSSTLSESALTLKLLNWIAYSPDIITSQSPLSYSYGLPDSVFTVIVPVFPAAETVQPCPDVLTTLGALDRPPSLFLMLRSLSMLISTDTCKGQ